MVMGETARVPLADVLDHLAAIAASCADAGAFSDGDHACPCCLQKATRAGEHDPDCAYRIARTRISPDDLSEVRRLARVLRYGTLR